MIFKEHMHLASLDTQVTLTEDLIDTLNEGVNFKEIKNKLFQRISNIWKSFLEWLKDIGEKIKRLIGKIKVRFSKKEENKADKDDEKTNKQNKILSLDYTRKEIIKDKDDEKEEKDIENTFSKQEMEILNVEKFLLDTKNDILNKNVKPIKRAVLLLIGKDAADINNELKNYIKLVEKYVPNIWDKHKEIEEPKPKDQWDESYLGLLQADLNYNFSKKRLNFLIEVAKYVYRNEDYVTKKYTPEVSRYVNSDKSESFIFILENVLLEDTQKIVISKKALPISSQKIRDILSQIKNPRNIDSIEKNNELIKKLNAEFEKFNSINDKIAVDNTFIVNNLQKLSNELNVHSKNLEVLYKMNVNSISKNDNNELLMSKIRLLNKAIVVVKDVFEICISSTV